MLRFVYGSIASAAAEDFAMRQAELLGLPPSPNGAPASLSSGADAVSRRAAMEALYELLAGAWRRMQVLGPA